MHNGKLRAKVLIEWYRVICLGFFLSPYFVSWEIY